MADQLRFDGKVVVITGAGAGLGKSHALFFGKRGAKVVVNDLGGSAHGAGKSSAAADAVVEEIKKGGGSAVANYDSVEEGAKIIKTAIDSFGRIDVLINNAGILRDVSFAKMTRDDWDLIMRVHVNGAFACTHAAWPYMRDQGYGRIVFTASAAGIYGNFGQANYATAKLGLVGFSNTLALEGEKKNVRVNTIAPVAASRLTETVMPREMLENLKPEYVTPLVAWLAHDECQETGGLFEVGAGFFGKLRWERTEGKIFKLGKEISPEAVRSSWEQITDFTKATHPANITEALAPGMNNLSSQTKGGNEFIDVDQALGYEFPELHAKYDERDLALYALGVGAGKNPTDTKDLHLVYERNGDGFWSLPTYGVIPALNAIFKTDAELRFFAGRALFTLQPELMALRNLRRDQLLRGIVLVSQVAEGRGSPPETKHFRDAVPERSWERLRQLVRKMGPRLDLSALSEGARHSVNRAGLVVCGGIAPAIASLRAKKALPSEMTELIRFAASERYLQLRNRNLPRR